MTEAYTAPAPSDPGSEAAPPFGARLWIASDRLAAAETHAELLARDGGRGVLSPGVKTLQQAAEAILSTSPHDFRPLSRPQRRGLIASLAERSERRRSFQPLLPLSGTAGLVDFLERRFTELRRRGLSADAAAGLLRQSEGVVGGALARLYESYLETLDEHRLLDREGRVALAAVQVATSPVRWRVLAIDLPTEPAPIERELLTRIAERTDEVLVSLPGDAASLAPSDREARLPAATARLARWREAFGEADGVVTLEPTAARPAALARLATALFDDDCPAADPLAGSGLDAIEVVAGASQADEVRRVARRVKALLAGGTRPGDVVVAARRLDGVAARLAEGLAEYGVPAAFETPPRLGEAPLAATLLTLLRLSESDWEFAAVLAAVGRRDLRAIASRGDERAAAEWFVRELQAPAGREYLLRQAETLAARAAEQGAEASPLQRNAEPAGRLLGRLSAALEALPREATPLAWFDLTRDLLNRLGYESADATHRLDEAATAAMEDALAGLESLADWTGRRAAPIGRRELLALVEAWATRLFLPQPAGAEGRVRVVSAETAVGLRCDHLFLVNVSESSFAGGTNEASTDDTTRGDGAGEEMLLFYELARRPAKSLTLSYAALDAAAQPLLPSPFLSDVERLFPKDALRRDTRLLEAVDADAAPLSPREQRMGAVSAAMSGKPKRLAALLNGDAGGTLAAGLGAIAARATGDTFGPFEGMLGPAAQAVLAERFGPTRLWSPTQLELYAACPFKFFARHVLGAEPVGELALDVDYRRRGSLVHDALAACCARLNKQLGAGLALSDLPEGVLAEALAEAIDAMARTGRLPPHEAALAAIEARQATEWAGEYPNQQGAYDKRWRALDEPLTPRHFEARFGPARGATDEEEDPASSDDPLEIALPGGETLRVTGRIDRVDVGRLGDQTLFSVVDYKTAKEVKAPRDDLDSGRQLQLAIYALAAERVLLADAGGMPVAAGYWAVQGKGFVETAKLKIADIAEGRATPTKDWLEAVDALGETLGRIVTGVRAGAFPMNHPDPDCGRRCEFRTVCRVGQARALDKSLDGSSEDGPRREAEQ